MPNPLDTVYRAVADVNRQLSAKDQLPLAIDTPLVGPQSSLDSLGLINLIVAVEHHVAVDFGADIILSEERTLAHADRVMATIGRLADYVNELLQETRSGGAET